MKPFVLILSCILLLTSSTYAQKEGTARKKKDYYYFSGAWQQMNFDELNTSLKQEGFKPIFENRMYLGGGWDGFYGKSLTGFDMGFSPGQRLRDSSGLRTMNSSLFFLRMRYGFAVIQKTSWDLVPYIGVNFDFLTISQGVYQDSINQWFRSPGSMQQLSGITGGIEPGIQFSWMPGIKSKNQEENTHDLRISLRAGYSIQSGGSTWYSNQGRLKGAGFAGGPFVTLTVGGWNNN
jgi:hypothetical protein